MARQASQADASRTGSRPATSAAAPEQTIQDSSHGAQIAARDKLVITTLNDATFSLQTTVGADGKIDFAEAGRVQAAGLTVRELETSLQDRLRGKWLINPQVTVDLMQAATKRVLVGGRVHNPQPYQFAGKTTVLEVLNGVGMPTDDAGDRAFIVRGNPDGSVPSADQMTEANKTYVDLLKLITEGDLSQNYTMNDGDYLFVEKALPFTITGEVKSPNQYPAHRGLTVQQAVALAGGLTDRAKSNGSGIKILRAGGDPKTSKPIDVKDWTKELVKPGDTITVPARIL
jgi:polysaccharide export outer membrane protein